jgi:hypothetical protein
MERGVWDAIGRGDVRDARIPPTFVRRCRTVRAPPVAAMRTGLAVTLLPSHVTPVGDDSTPFSAVELPC